MTLTGMEEQSDEKRAEFEEEAIKIINRAKEKGITLRLLGSLSFQFQCPQYAHIQKQLGRSYTDIDYAGYSNQASKMHSLFQALGYEEDAEVNLFYAGQRMIFYHKTNGIHVDVFFDKLDFCHEIKWAGRLEIEELTLPLAEMVLEKMQIVKINEKDVIDSAMLLLEKQIGNGDRDMINIKLISELCAKDWGLWRTVTMNLQKVAQLVQRYEPLTEGEKARVGAQVAQMLKRIDEEPKSTGWKIRSKIGDKVKWYKEVEEVHG
jgi:hypothetical protein